MSDGPTADLDDLAVETAEQTDDADDDGEPAGEFIMRMFDRLDEKGIIDAAVAQNLDMDPGALREEMADGEEDAPDADAINAQVVANFGKVVIDNFGDISMTEMVQYAEQNPAAVNQAIKQALGGEQ